MINNINQNRVDTDAILGYIPTVTYNINLKEIMVMSMPISSEASQEERSTTIPKGSRVQVDSKRPTPQLWGDDIVCSSWKREAALKKLVKNIKISSDDCWEWQGSKTVGYGTLKLPEVYGNFKILAHRLSWVVFKGEFIPDGLFVCHRCDNPKCINPDHLFLGTQRDNLQDCSDKKRTMTGSLNGNSKYSEQDIKKVMMLIESGKTGVEISKVTGVSRTHISRIKRGYTWTAQTLGTANYVNGNRKYTDEQVMKVAELLNYGNLKCIEIARLAGVSRYVVSDMKNGKVYQRFMKRVGSNDTY